MSVHDWIYTREQLAHTASRRVGVDEVTEARYRREGVKLIFDVGKGLSINPHPTLATAAVFFHRFYMMHSFRTFNRHVTAISCLFLAGKVEETPKKCKDIVAKAQECMAPELVQRMGNNPMEEVMIVERILLQTLKFDLTVEHPYAYLIEYAKMFTPKGDTIQKMVQMAWTFVNDSLHTTLSLRWEPEVIAMALMHLASKMTDGVELDWTGKQPNRRDWWSEYVDDLSEEQIKLICDEVLDLYVAQNAKRQQNQQPGTSAGSTPGTPMTPGQQLATTPGSSGSATSVNYARQQSYGNQPPPSVPLPPPQPPSFGFPPQQQAYPPQQQNAAPTHNDRRASGGQGNSYRTY